jgi:hypothetical protein
MTRKHDTPVSAEDAPDGNPSKIERVIAEYDLQSIDDTLADFWTRENEERFSLRELASYFNQRVLQAAMEDAGMDPLDGEVENLHRLLTDEESSQGMRIQARKRLEQQGIDVDDVTGDFVSYQSINRYLKGPLGLEYSAEETDRIETGTARIAALQNRTVAVTEDTLRGLRANGDLRLGEFDVFVNVTVTCSDCGETATVREFLDDGGCRCSAS